MSVLIEAVEKPYDVPEGKGIGIDLGIRDFAVVNIMENPLANINKTTSVRDLKKRLKRQQRRLSRKYESLKARNKEMKGEATRQNIHKQTIKVQKLHQILSCIRQNHIHQGISQQNFYSFKQAELEKCGSMRKELKSSDRTYRCHGCGFVIDRDRSASINLLNAKVYAVAP